MFANIQGRRIWYSSEGKGEPLILIPGGPGFSHRRISPYFAPLSRSLRLISYDPFGRGLSDRAHSASEYSLDRDVEDLEGLRRHLGLEKVHLLGHSYGGLVAQRYAKKYPTHVASIILESTVSSHQMWQEGPIESVNHEIQNQFPEIWEKLQAITAEGRKSSDAKYQETMGDIAPIVAMRYLPHAKPSAPSLLESDWNSQVYFALVGDDPERMISGDLLRFDMSLDPISSEIPILLAYGRFDRSVPQRLVKRIRALYPWAHYEVFEHSGHAPHAEESERFLSVVKDFISHLRPAS